MNQPAAFSAADLRRTRVTAVLISGAVTAGIFVYVFIVEAVSRYIKLTPPLSGEAAVAARYGLYFCGVLPVFALKFIRPAIKARVSVYGPASTLLAQSIAAAALCEIPALMGLVIFFLAGAYWDFYMLAAFSAVMEFVNFPRQGAWEEKARNEYGVLPG